MEGYSVVGKRLPRVDGVLKATGEARYTDDMSFHGTLVGKILRSPHPHAKVLKIDTSKARRVIGVRAVITGKDTPGVKIGAIEAFPQNWDKYPLAIDKVRYIGDEVAAVAAMDEDIAEEVLDLIQVDYEELPAVFDPEEAMKPDAPRVHDVEGNIGMQTLLEFGDVEGGFNESYLVREDRFVTQPVAHCCMEPHISLAIHDSSGKLTLWTSTQAPFQVHRTMAKALKMPEGMVRVIKPYVGGGFGAKIEAFAMDVCCALLSWKTGRPVKITLNREEEFSFTRFRHPIIIQLKTGVKRDGTIVAKKCKNILDGGAYIGIGNAATFLSTLFLNLPYKSSSIKFEAYRIYTTKAIAGAMRGFTSPQVHFATESQMDMLAEELGIDPLEMRLKNAIQPGYVTPSKLRIKSCGFTECLKRSSENMGWQVRDKKVAEGKGLGIGCSGFLCGSAFPVVKTPGDYYSAALIRLDPDGTASLLSGASDIGQGSDTVLAQVAAEELGISLKDIRITTADTELTPLDSGSYSSKVTLMGGNAVKMAASEAKQQLFKTVAEKLEANPEDLESREGRVYVKGSPERGVSFAEGVWICQESGKGMPVIGRGYYHPETGTANYETGEGNYSPAYSFGSSVAEVEVDRETGLTKVRKVTYAHDCGFALNPMAVEGQLQGSISMGHGFALFEEVHGDKGQILNPSFLDYKLHTAIEMPEINIIIVETNEKEGPFGAKEASEGIVSPTAPAIVNAIYSLTGMRIKELPLTPERILDAIGKKRKPKSV